MLYPSIFNKPITHHYSIRVIHSCKLRHLPAMLPLYVLPTAAAPRLAPPRVSLSAETSPTERVPKVVLRRGWQIGWLAALCGWGRGQRAVAAPKKVVTWQVEGWQDLWKSWKSLVVGVAALAFLDLGSCQLWFCFLESW